MAVLGSALARLGIDFDRAAAASAVAVAAAYIMRQCAEALDPSAALGLAVTGLVEGSKTEPDPAML